MRYGYGMILGAVLSAGVCLSGAAIALMTYGVTDANTLDAIWNVHIVWAIISMVVILLPPIAAFGLRWEFARRLTILEAGSLMLFTPFWLALATEIAGSRWVVLLTEGRVPIVLIRQVDGTLTAAVLGLAVPVLLAAMVLVGVFIVRPAFVDTYGEYVPAYIPPTTTPSVSPPVSGPPETPPSVTPPSRVQERLDELHTLLRELGLQDPIIRRVVEAGYKTVPDFLAAKPEDISAATGIDIHAAEQLLLQAQKKVWFGGI